MKSSTATPIFLFSYGTLQDKNVQLANLGRELLGRADALPGYQQTFVEITDPKVVATSGKTHHPIVQASAAWAQMSITRLLRQSYQNQPAF